MAGLVMGSEDEKGLVRRECRGFQAEGEMCAKDQEHERIQCFWGTTRNQVRVEIEM